MNIIEFIENATAEGGGSYCFNNGETNPSTGYMVSLFEREKITPELTLNIIKDYVVSNLDLLAVPKYFLGMWKNDDVWYLDVSCNVAEEGNAIAMGEENHQKAIWDCKNKCEVWVERVSNVG